MSNVPATTDPLYDVAIIGGGINGVAIARDAALRGLRVYLCEKGDLANETSSVSSKIIHGGLRYLETYEFAMVRKSLKEREVLLNIAPHLVAPLGFVLPHNIERRPRWLIRLGLFVYDHLYRSKYIPKAKKITFNGTPLGKPLKKHFKHGFTYGDAWADDARLVTLTALDAAQHGAHVETRTTCQNTHHDGQSWRLTTLHGGVPKDIRAKALVNATGPWAEAFLKGVGLEKASKPLTLVKGSHIIVPKLFDHKNAYTLQTHDGRVVFAFPYEKQFTLIGTTDTPHTDPTVKAEPDLQEIQYLCDVVNGYFEKQTTPQDVIWSFSGVRPLVGTSDGESPSKLSRDYTLEHHKSLALLNVWGGKLTSHRRLAQEAVDTLCAHLNIKKSCQTAVKPLPGGDIPKGGLPALIRKLQGMHPWLSTPTANRLVHAYGTQAEKIFAGHDTRKTLGQHFGADLYQLEVDYLVQHEWAQTAEDILWRRTKLGLHTSLADQTALRGYLARLS